MNIFSNIFPLASQVSCVTKGTHTGDDSASNSAGSVDSGITDTESDLEAAAARWYYDGDGDTYPLLNISVATDPYNEKYIKIVQSQLDMHQTDCDDSNPDVNPGTTEICNGIDDNCNQLIDSLDDSVHYAESDVQYTDDDGDRLSGISFS